MLVSHICTSPSHNDGFTASLLYRKLGCDCCRWYHYLVCMALTSLVVRTTNFISYLYYSPLLTSDRVKSLKTNCRLSQFAKYDRTKIGVYNVRLCVLNPHFWMFLIC